VILDIAILVIVAIAVFIGYKRGAIQPVLVYGGFALVVLVLISHWTAYTKLLDTRLHSNAVIDAIVVVIVATVVAWLGGKLGGLIHRMPVVRGADGLLGVFVNGLLAIYLIYVVLSMFVSLDKAFATTLGETSTTEAQAVAIARWVGGNPILSRLIGQGEIAGLVKAAKQPGGADLTNYSSLQTMQTVYKQLVYKELRTSHLAGVVLWIGDHTPIVGHLGPRDLPSSKPSPSPSASPAATPTP
jgi:uncharacterized membrane protein required for colicin V production